MASTIRVGLIGGTGDFAQTHIDGIARTDGLELVWLHGRDPDRLAERAEAAGAEACTDWSQGLDTVDAVILCTPPTLRSEPIAAAAAAGKHVLCEKPVALGLAEARAIAGKVRDAGIVFQVDVVHRFDPAYRRLGLLYQEGRLGELVYAYVRSFEFAPSARWLGHKAAGHWRADYATSGGRILELGSHWLDWLAWVGGPPRQVTGYRETITPDIDVDDANLLSVTFDHGVGRLELFRCPVAVESIAAGIVGTQGAVHAEAGTIRFREMDEEAETELEPLTDGPTPWQHFRDCIVAGIAPEADIEAGLTVLAMGLAFNASAEAGQPVDVAI